MKADRRLLSVSSAVFWTIFVHFTGCTSDVDDAGPDDTSSEQGPSSSESESTSDAPTDEDTASDSEDSASIGEPDSDSQAETEEPTDPDLSSDSEDTALGSEPDDDSSSEPDDTASESGPDDDSSSEHGDSASESDAASDSFSDFDTSVEPPDSDTSVESDTDFRDIALSSNVTEVKPMTGIVMWNDSQFADASEIQLEYAYLGYDKVAIAENPSQWDWSDIDALLEDIASHGHQAIFRFYDTYPGFPTTVPQFIKNRSDYHETSGTSEGEPTDYPDWSNAAFKDFMMSFFTEVAARYDDDPRLAFLEVGFGLWAEYHLYDPGENLGVNFPDMEFQEQFLSHLAEVFTTLRWMVSIDAADESNTPFATVPGLSDLRFGVFDDSFLNEEHDGYNKECFDFFGEEKRMQSPVGGELSYYTDFDQRHALDPTGPHGVSFEEAAATYNVSFMIGADQPQYQSWDRIKQAGIAAGYHFEITAFRASATTSMVSLKNIGIAPIYYDAYIAVNGVRSALSLMGLQPGDTLDTTIPSGGENPTLTIACDRLVDGQRIPFEAHL